MSKGKHSGEWRRINQMKWMKEAICEGIYGGASKF